MMTMRTVNKIIVHCSDTPEGRDDRAADIKRWHTAKPPKGNGWSDIGYHYVIDLDGTVEPGRPVDTVGAHCSGHNADSVGVCYVGGRGTDGLPKDTRTVPQKFALRTLLKYLLQKYPGAQIYGHRDFANKPCPCFDAKTEYKDLWRE